MTAQALILLSIQKKQQSAEKVVENESLEL